MIVLEPVQAAVWNCLQNFMYADAVFIAERLHAELKTEESAHTLAVAYFNNSSIHQAYDVLHRSSLTRPLNKFLFARCCCVMNKRQEAETTLLGHHVRKPAGECIESLVAEYEDIACFVLVMLGEIYLKTERKKLAVRALNRALTLNPCLFSAYKLLCDAGESPNPKEVFKFETVDALNLTMGASCWTNFAHAKVTLNQSIPVHPHHHFSHVFPEEHSTPFPTTTPVVDSGKPWQPPAPCKAKLDGGRLSPTANLNGKRQLELQTPAGNGKRPAFGALFVGDASDNSIVMNSSFLELAPKPVSHPIAAAAQSSTALNIKDLQPAPPVNQVPLKSTPLVVSQTNNVSAEQSQDGEVRPIVPDVQPPLKRSARLQPATAVTKENKGTAKGRNLSRPSSTNAGGNGGGLSKRPRNTRGGGNGRTARGLLPVDSENENKTQGGPSVSETSNNQALSSPPPTASPVAVENTKNLEKTAAAIEEERPGVFELAAQAQKQSAAGLMKLFQVLGSAYRNLCQYDCVEGLKALRALSNQQLKTGWVMCLKARLYFELGMFDEAVKVFEQVREMEPMRLEGLEYYSSALWQLQREVDLSALAGSLMDINHHHWVPWMSLANCFSASQEHNTAIKYFQRALQLNHESSYVYCLLAQEFFIVDDIENSQAAFRNALYVNQNDYRAWMGLGMVSFKQEVFKLAKVSYRKALRLNPMSTMVMCQLGLCLVKMKETSDAIETFKRALEVNPRNPLCKYHLASTLVLAYQFEAAKDLLLELTEETPREAQVFFLLGKIFKKLGKENLSLMYISWAVDLDPKVGKAPWKDRAASGVTADLDNGADHPPEQSLSGTNASSVDVPSAQAAEGQVFNSAAMANEGENADLMLHSGFEGEADESGDEDGAGDDLATSPVADASYVAGSSA